MKISVIEQNVQTIESVYTFKVKIPHKIPVMLVKCVVISQGPDLNDENQHLKVVMAKIYSREA